MILGVVPRVSIGAKLIVRHTRAGLTLQHQTRLASLTRTAVLCTRLAVTGTRFAAARSIIKVRSGVRAGRGCRLARGLHFVSVAPHDALAIAVQPETQIVIVSRWRA